MLDSDQNRLTAQLEGIAEQIEKRHFLNVHFRAFRLANDAWQEHIRMNAITGGRHAQSPAGAVLDNNRDDK